MRRHISSLLAVLAMPTEDSATVKGTSTTQQRDTGVAYNCYNSVSEAANIAPCTRNNFNVCNQYHPLNMAQGSIQTYPCQDPCSSPYCVDGTFGAQCLAGQGSPINNSQDCNDIDICQSIDCNDVGCFNASPACLDTACLSTVTNNKQSLTTCTPMECLWPMSDQQCDIAASTTNKLGQNMLRDHDKSQASLAYLEAQFARPVSAPKMPSHLIPGHQLGSFSCLWQNCGQSFLDCESRDHHVKVAHPYIDGRWGGCGMSIKGPVQPQSHINSDHPNIGVSSNFQDSPNLGGHQSLGSPSFMFPGNCNQPMQGLHQQPAMLGVSTWPSLNTVPSAFTPHHEPLQPKAPSSRKRVSKNRAVEQDGKCECKWLPEHSHGPICGMVFENGNALQLHVEQAHITPSRLDYLAGKPVVCMWQNCEKNGTRMQHDLKLKLHTHTHTGCRS